MYLRVLQASQFGPGMAEWLRNAPYIREVHTPSSKPCLEHMPHNLEVAEFSSATHITPQGLERLASLRNLKVSPALGPQTVQGMSAQRLRH